MDAPNPTEAVADERARSTTSLFRRAALEHAGHSLHGRVMLARPPSWALLATVYGAVAALAAGYFAAVEFAHQPDAAATAAQVSCQTSACGKKAQP